MNPRGNQYALAHTLDGWARLDHPTPRQARALRRSYTGLNPLVYSRYGRRQWAAPLPWTRLIMKDPFAMLSLPAVARTTGTTPVLLYRHPGAVLASYRRMGWEPDLEELQPVVRAYRARATRSSDALEDLPRVGEASPAVAMGRFWGALYAIALGEAQNVPGLVIVSHEEVAQGGVRAARCLLDALGLSWSDETAVELAKETGGSGSTTGNELHNFDRPPAEVATAWRGKLEPGDLDEIEAATSEIRTRLEAARLPLLG